MEETGSRNASFPGNQATCPQLMGSRPSQHGHSVGAPMSEDFVSLGSRSETEQGPDQSEAITWTSLR